MFKFDQKEVTPKNFYRQRRIIDISTIDVNKVVVSNKVSCNNGKYCSYVVGYQVNEAPIPWFIKTPKNKFSYGVSQHDKNSAYSMSFNVFEAKECVSQYRMIWNEIESRLFEKLTMEPIKGKYVNGKLKMWKEHIKTNFHGQDVPYDIYCNATGVLKVNSVYKQGKNYHPQVYVEEGKYTGTENRQCNLLSNDDDHDDDDDGFFEL